MLVYQMKHSKVGSLFDTFFFPGPCTKITSYIASYISSSSSYWVIREEMKKEMKKWRSKWPGKRPNYWTDFDALLHTNYILVSDVTRRIFFQKSQKMWKRCTHMHISGFTPYIPKKICKTTGPILMPFCIRTTYWSPTWLSAYCFFKNLKIWQHCTHICIFRVLLHNTKICNQIWRNFTYSFLDEFLKFL